MSSRKPRNITVILIASFAFALGCEVLDDNLDDALEEDSEITDDEETFRAAAASQKCSSVNEGSTATLSCPSGQTISRIDFASYGTPVGTCGAGFAESACHASSSGEKVEDACLDEQSCTVSATNGFFGDPCRGTHKKLSILYTCSGGAQSGLLGTYFDNMDFTDRVLERVDPTVSFDWGRGTPDAALDGNSFSVRWTGYVQARSSETYTFYTVSDDGVRLFVDGKLLIDNWTNHGPTENTGTIALKAGDRYSIKMEYYENGGGAVAKLLWSAPRQAKQIIPQSQLTTQLSDDLCPGDPNKTEPGLCGCGVAEGTCGQQDALFEAEEFTGISGCKKATNHAGYTGSGFVDFGANGTWFERNDVSVDQAGDYTLTIRYANGSASARRGVVIVNGREIGNVPFGTTGGWPKWDTDSIKVSLRQGSNTIRVKANTGSGGPNVDHLTLTLDNVVEDNCPDDPNKTEPGDCGCGVPEGTCEGCPNTLLTDQVLHAGDDICSQNDAFRFGMSDQGNLSLRQGDKVLWSANTCCGSAFAAMQGDGNLVVYDGTAVRFASNTANNPGATLTLENDGRAVIRLGNVELWSVSGPQFGSGTLDKPAGTTLRVADYNVLRSSIFPLDNGNPGKSTRVESFERVALAIDADIWAMQEVLYDGNDKPGRSPEGLRRHMEDITGDDWYMSHHTELQEFVFSRYPIIDDGSPDRRVHWALIDVPQSVSPTDVLIFSVHFVGDDATKTKRAKAIATLIAKVLDDQHNTIADDVTIIVTGDFNAGPGSNPYNTVKAAIGSPDLRPKQLGTDDVDKTHCQVSFEGGTWKVSGSVIDYVFYRSSVLKAHNSFGLNTLILDDAVLDTHDLEWTDVAVNPNNSVNVNNANVNLDHLPLVTDFRIR